MNISKQEAQESLEKIENVVAQTRKAMGIHTGYILMLWGVIWAVAFLANQFMPRIAGWKVWLPLDTIGFIGTWICIKKSKTSFRRPGGGRIGLAWLILFAYLILWNFLLHPANDREGMAFCSTVVMCAYVMMGLWLSRFLLWLGVTVTALTVIGFDFVTSWFPLWMGITGGGALFFSGLYIRKSWK